MSKHSKIIIGIGVAVVAAVVVYLGFIRGDDVVAPSDEVRSDAQSVKIIDACGTFTLLEAQSVMGEGAKKGVAAAPVQSDDVRLSTCSYTVGGGDVASVKSAAVMVRSPMNDAGKTSNKDAFAGKLPAGSEPVEGYGSQAFWDPATGSLNILKDDYWYSIAYGGLDVTGNTLEQTKPLADKIIN